MRLKKITRQLLVAAFAVAPGLAHAQAYPSRPISIVVPSTAGGVLDIVARNLAEPMAADLGQPVIVLNKPGGNSHIGASFVAKTVADGYNLLCAAGSTLVSGVSKNLTYDPMNDLIPVARIVSAPVFLVVAGDSPFQTFADLLNYGKANKGKMFFASSGAGNSTHIGAEMLNGMTGIGATHVPYRGSVPALTDVAGGRVQFMLDTRASTTALIQAGKLRPLAVTSPQRVKDYPEIPSVSELVPGFEIEGWVGIFAAKDTKPEIIVRLTESLKKAVANPEVVERLRNASGEVTFLAPDAARKFQLEDHERISKVVRDANISVD